MQSHARVVIVGGGIMGVGLLYHLAEAGWTDCVLIEKAELTSGSTWHAAGQCPNFTADYNVAKIQHYSNVFYPKLEALTGQAVGWQGVGGIRLATTKEELDYFQVVEGISKNVGFRMQIIGPDEIRRLNPFINLQGVLAGAWTLDDGYVDPAGVTNAMAIAAKNMGATIIRHNRVRDIQSLPSGEWKVISRQGTIICEHVVNAGGCYAAQIGAWVGLDLPITNMKHQYLVTEPIQEFINRDDQIPVMRDPYPNAYYRQEQKSGLIGIYERVGTQEAWFGAEQDWEAESELFAPDFDVIMPGLERVMERMPIFAEAGIRRVINGANPRTPDHNPLLGPAPGLRNFWLSCGQNMGIGQGAGAGKYLAQWIMHGAANINMVGVDPRRFGPYADRDYARAKAHQDFSYMYILRLPGEERPAGRPARTSPLFKKLKNKGAKFGETFGWERPKWFSLDGREEEKSYRRNNIFDLVGDECRAVRDRVGILDLSSFTKHEVTGPDAEAFLNRILANRVPRRKGGIVLAHGLTKQGRIQSEYTVTRLDDETFFLLSAAAANTHDSDHLQYSKQEGERITIKNITDHWGSLILAGPRSRDLLSKLTDTDLSNKNFPWLTAKEIEVAGVNLLALRINYVGELGWELHMPINWVETIYDIVWKAGLEFGLVDFGMYALASLGKEKAYYSWGVELTNEITLIEAGMERFVDFEKGDFIGREALLRHKNEPLAWNIAYVEVTTHDSDARGSEPVFDGKKVIGVTSSGAFGHTVEKSLAFAFIPPEYNTPGTTLDIEILGQCCPAKVLAGAAFDPQNLRLRS